MRKRDRFWKETLMGLGLGVVMFVCIVAMAYGLSLIFG